MNLTRPAMQFITLAMYVLVVSQNVLGDEVTRANDTTEQSFTDKLTGLVASVKQQASETLDNLQAGTVLNKLPAQVTDGLRNTENKLIGDDALNRLESSKRETVAKAKKMMDEALLKLKSTVEQLKIKHSDGDDVTNTLDTLLEKIEIDGKAAFDYTSNVLNETAQKAKAAVEKAQKSSV
ncbi:uncharacterized protein LOC126835660 [Adelges cooleyi]|uniref:uncharacterized protein LOC126835660 n=1 Tax=Adelges cooleyi TaxID=133065 RepID=UPI0021800534|nr:uncharacterized protein LOC126835660 [Adelges cooleyi]